MNESVSSQNVERLERLLLLTEQMQEELEQKDRVLEELKAQNEELQSLNERLNKENNSGKLQALENDLQRVNGFLKSERERAQRTESILEAYQDKERQAERMRKQALARQERKAAHYRTVSYLLGWYAATTTLFTAILSPVFLSDCKIFFCTLEKGIWFVGKQFLQWADYTGRKGSGIIDGPFPKRFMDNGRTCFYLSFGRNRGAVGCNRTLYRDNISEILLGYHQYHGGNNEYGYRNLLWRMDKICHSTKPHCTVTSCACGLYRNPMLHERLAGK